LVHGRTIDVVGDDGADRKAYVLTSLGDTARLVLDAVLGRHRL
jgi:hypothetical protein